MPMNSKTLLEVLKQEELNKKKFPERQPLIKMLINEVSKWPEIEIHTHLYGGTEFRLFNKSIGHIHSNGMLDLPFVKDVRKRLLEENLVELHHVNQTMNWVIKQIDCEDDLKIAKSLLLLSYCIKGQVYFDRFEQSSRFIHAKLLNCQFSETIFAADILGKHLPLRK